jgi:hypothetical protein
MAAIDPVIQASTNRDTGDLAMASSARQAASELKRIGATTVPVAQAPAADDGVN